MAMHPALIYFLLDKKNEFGITGRVLTIGQQTVLLSSSKYHEIFGKLPAQDTINDLILFQAMGAGCVESIDYFGSKATFKYDLNKPLENVLSKGEFDLVLDGGTLEHCFNVGVYMESVVRLVRSGGRVLHITACQGYPNHGFYNFQPTFFFDFYDANGWDDMHCYIFEHLDKDYYSENCKVKILKVSAIDANFATSNNTLLVFSARKVLDVENITFPIQRVYR